MDSLVSLFEVVVLGSTGLSLAALAGFIVWDSLVDAGLRHKASATVRMLPGAKNRETTALRPHFAKAA
jgi:hypothetical protein